MLSRKTCCRSGPASVSGRASTLGSLLWVCAACAAPDRGADASGARGSQAHPGFAPAHQQTVDALLGRCDAAVVRGEVVSVKPLDSIGVGTVCIRCAAAVPAWGIGVGDVVTTYHKPQRELEEFGIATDHAALSVGDTRMFLIERKWYRLFLRIPGTASTTAQLGAAADAPQRARG